MNQNRGFWIFWCWCSYPVLVLSQFLRYHDGKRDSSAANHGHAGYEPRVVSICLIFESEAKWRKLLRILRKIEKWQNHSLGKIDATWRQICQKRNGFRQGRWQHLSKRHWRVAGELFIFEDAKFAGTSKTSVSRYEWSQNGTNITIWKTSLLDKRLIRFRRTWCQINCNSAEMSWKVLNCTFSR